MQNLITGKGIYIWQLWRCGPIKEIIENVKKAGMTHIIPKIADGNYEYVGNSPYLNELVTRAHNAGIKVIPYQFVYGKYADGEAIQAINQLRKYPYDGFVINAEMAYRDLPNSSTAAKIYCEKLTKTLPDLALYLSTFRRPSLHRGFPFKTFLSYMNGNMPQVYWMKNNGDVPNELAKSLAEYANLPDVPYIPTGAAFNEHGWAATTQDQIIFIKECLRLGLQACNWWEYRHAFILRPELGEAIASVDFEHNEPPVVEPPVIEPPIEEAIFRAECIASELNVRSTPAYLADNSNRVRSLFKGDRVYVYDEYFDGRINWFKIGPQEFCSGHEKYMKRIEEEESLTYEEKVDILWERFKLGLD